MLQYLLHIHNKKHRISSLVESAQVLVVVVVVEPS